MTEPRGLRADFIRDVERAAEILGIKPDSLITRHTTYGGGVWQRWMDSDESSPGLHMADRIRAGIHRDLPDFQFSEDIECAPEAAE